MSLNAESFRNLQKAMFDSLKSAMVDQTNPEEGRIINTAYGEALTGITFESNRGTVAIQFLGDYGWWSDEYIKSTCLDEVILRTREISCIHRINSSSVKFEMIAVMDCLSLIHPECFYRTAQEQLSGNIAKKNVGNRIYAIPPHMTIRNTRDIMRVWPEKEERVGKEWWGARKENEQDSLNEKGMWGLGEKPRDPYRLPFIRTHYGINKVGVKPLDVGFARFMNGPGAETKLKKGITNYADILKEKLAWTGEKIKPLWEDTINE